MLTDSPLFKDPCWSDHVKSLKQRLPKLHRRYKAAEWRARGILADLSRSPQKRSKPSCEPQDKPLMTLGLKLRLSGKGTLSMFGTRSPKARSRKPIGFSKPDSPLGLSSVTKSRTPSPQAAKPKGRKGITTHGKDMVKDMACLLEREYDRRQLSFGTATLPSLPDDDLYQVQVHWSEICNRFFEELGRHFKRKGLEWRYLYCSEIQPKRWLSRREVGLHLHWLCVGRSNPWEDWAITPSEVAAIWARVLGRVLGYEPDCTKATRVEIPRKSVKRELGKYLSKGCKVVQEIVNAGLGDRLPNAWWGGLTALKREVFAQTFVFDSQVAEAIQSRLEEMVEAGLCTVSHVYREFKGKTIWVATVIYWRADYDVILGYLRNLESEYSSA